MSLEDGDLVRLRAVAHPLRLRMLSLLTGVELSAAEVARELDITQANASYHLRRLAAAGVLVEAGTHKVNGGTARRYRYVAGTGNVTTADDDLLLFEEARHQELIRRIALMGKGPRQLSEAEVWLPEDRWREIADEFAQLSRRVHDEAVPPRTAGAVPVNFSANLFTMRTDVEDTNE